MNKITKKVLTVIACLMLSLSQTLLFVQAAPEKQKVEENNRFSIKKTADGILITDNLESESAVIKFNQDYTHGTIIYKDGTIDYIKKDTQGTVYINNIPIIISEELVPVTKAAPAGYKYIGSHTIQLNDSMNLMSLVGGIIVFIPGVPYASVLSMASEALEYYSMTHNVKIQMKMWVNYDLKRFYTENTIFSNGIAVRTYTWSGQNR